MQESEVGKATAEVLDVLAAKFGTTAAYLWGVMVRQEVVYGFFALGLAMAFAGAATVFCRWGLVWSRVEDRYADTEGRRIITFLGTLALGAMALGWAYDAMTGLYNPQYAALRSVLSLINPN